MSLAMAAGMKRIPWQQFCAGYGEMRQTQGRTAFGTGRMDLEQAKRILNISAEDDIGAVKRKYRRLIGCHHPDAIGSDRPEHISAHRISMRHITCLRKAACYLSPGGNHRGGRESLTRRLFATGIFICIIRWMFLRRSHTIRRPEEDICGIRMRKTLNCF